MTAITETRQSVETKVIRTRTQTTESARTETASYALDVTRENGILTAVTARVSYPVDGTAPAAASPSATAKSAPCPGPTAP